MAETSIRSKQPRRSARPQPNLIAAVPRPPPGPIPTRTQPAPAPAPAPHLQPVPAQSYQPFRLPATSQRPPSPVRAVQPPRPAAPFQKLEGVLGGTPHYLDQPGPQNRIVLSLKSGVAQDVDYALEILLAASFYEPEAVQLARYPGLVDALLALLATYVPPGAFEDPLPGLARRRALEATLILRNFITLDHFARTIAANPRLPIALLGGLEAGSETSDPEYLAMLLEILEGAATQGIALDRPLSRDPALRCPAPDRPVPSSEQAPAAVEGNKQPAERPPQWACDLFAALDSLTSSQDRNLVLGAYRAFAALGRLPHNQAVLGLLALERCELTPGPSSWPGSLARAFSLLALPDLELLLAVLDYLYALTVTPSLALALCAHHTHLQPLTKLLLLHIRHHAHVYSGIPQTLPAPAQQWFWSRPVPPAALPKTTQAPPQTPTMAEVHKILLDESAIGPLASLPEPQRARAWMQSVFEPCQDAEVQQVTLWLAYKTQFETSISKVGGVQMIAPADAIKLTTDVFPNAVPSVVETGMGERKFVIKGIRPREKIAVPAIDLGRCKWTDCEQTGLVGPEQVYRHLIAAHVSSAPASSACHWHTCTAQPADLRSHLATHLAPASATTRPPQPVIEKALFERLPTSRYESPHGDPDEHGALGIGYVSCLVLRNLMRAVAEREVNEDEEQENEEDEEIGNRIIEGGWLERELVGWAIEDRWLSGLASEMLGLLDIIERRLDTGGKQNLEVA